MSNDQKILEAVDQIAERLDPDEIEETAERLGITVEELMHRVGAEVLGQVTGQFSA